jgi:hypothetical protein
MPSGEVFASGSDGLILRGRRDAWIALEQDMTDETIVSIASFGPDVYFATEDAVLLALRGSDLRMVEIEKNESVSTGFLDSNGTSLLSVGMKDVYLYDGKKWRRLSDPKFDRQ